MFLHFDARGTMVDRTSAGADAGGWAAEPNFGYTQLLSYPDYGYAGYRFDDATQLYYTRNRYYDPYLGRFLSPDPIGLAGGINFYAYAGDDPINGVDPSGLSSTDAQSNLSPGAISILAGAVRGIGDNGGPALEEALAGGGASVLATTLGAVAGVLVPNTSIASDVQEQAVIQAGGESDAAA